MNRMYQFASHFNPIPETVYERPIQTIEKPPSSASSKLYNITKDETFANYEKQPYQEHQQYVTHKQPQKQPKTMKQQAFQPTPQQQDHNEKKIHCPKFDEYKAYLYGLQHGFPTKDYNNYVPPAKKSSGSKNGSKPEKRVFNIKPTVLQPYNNPYNAHSTLNRLSAMNNSLYHNLLKSESLMRPRYSSMLLTGD